MRKVKLDHGFGFALELDEETVFINSLENVRKRIPATESWLATLDWRFYECGHLLSDEHARLLNMHLRRCGMELIEFRETNPLNMYIREKSYEEHKRNRQAVRDELLGSAPGERERLVAEAAKRVAALESAHRTWAELNAERPFEVEIAAPRTRVVASCGTVAPVSAPPPVLSIMKKDDAEKSDIKIDGISEMNAILAEVAKLSPSTLRKRLVEVVVEHYL
jgi:hypothetical protein